MDDGFPAFVSGAITGALVASMLILCFAKDPREVKYVVIEQKQVVHDVTK